MNTDAYPILTVQDILESFSGAVLFFTVNLDSRYWQVHKDDHYKSKIAFIYLSGLHFKVMTFGHKNAPASFQRLMERGLGDLHGKTVLCTSMTIYSPSIQQHLLDIQAILDNIQYSLLTVNIKKTEKNVFMSFKVIEIPWSCGVLKRHHS